jgi:hypothetical protein
MLMRFSHYLAVHALSDGLGASRAGLGLRVALLRVELLAMASPQDFQFRAALHPCASNVNASLKTDN